MERALEREMRDCSFVAMGCRGCYRRGSVVVTAGKNGEMRDACEHAEDDGDRLERKPVKGVQSEGSEAERRRATRT